MFAQSPRPVPALSGAAVFTADRGYHMGYDRRDSGDHRAAPARTGTVEGNIVICSWLGWILQYVAVVRGVFPSGDDQERTSIRARSGAERTERGSFQLRLNWSHYQA